MKIMRLLPLIAAATLAACADRSSPTTETMADAEQAVLAAHEQRRVATLAADVEALDSMMTAGLTFTHPNGVEESKAEFLGTLQTGTLRYQSITDEDRRVRIHGDAAVVSGVVRLVLTAAGAPIDIRVRFTELWTREIGSWRMVLWHAAAVS